MYICIFLVTQRSLCTPARERDREKLVPRAAVLNSNELGREFEGRARIRSDAGKVREYKREKEERTTTPLAPKRQGTKRERE